MKLSVRERLEDQGISVKEDHISVLEKRWQAIEQMKVQTKDASLADYDISLRNIPGGDHIE
ncbi:hypothetical protein [Bacillus thermotolerans]|uniref:Uncharacterized protein n=1 Tax=Bacillus thermotolerans TaxID=1221996 RepID=A0A0F5HXA8_BACTR|nr:hypothetical protein [Bacillus thermotolerans]KKB34318.1 hypothetical protein QY95_03929 [Bacillus thermotolerans]KKB37873.1 hypothetical protein QY97_03778 [Bacillus thermotolerans]KKB39700.1 hypothetical protein QY96_02733 [Bacillus thermotolerans]